MAAEPARALSPPRRLHFRNPFVLRVGQVMTGFGIGCGLGIGIGRPINLGALPGVGDVLSGAGGLSRKFGGVSHQVQTLIKVVGIKNLEAGVGCGVGIGHGFGAGIALKPGVTQQLMQFLQHGLQMLAGRLQASPGDLHEGSSLANNPNMLVTRQPPAPVSQSGQEISGSGLGRSSKTNPDEGSSKTNVDEGSLQLFKTRLSDSEVDALRSENDILRTLLRHQKVIEDLKEDNAALLRALNLKTNTTSYPVDQSVSVHRTNSTRPTKVCFDCRRKARRRC